MNAQQRRTGAFQTLTQENQFLYMQNGRLLAQRDELLAALKALQSAAHKQNYYFGTVSGQVQAAIANASK